MSITVETRCGYVSIVGAPNAGKSTLLNKLIGQKLSITCRKPQTTRHAILGIKTKQQVQALYVDTPGLHQETPRAINREMNRAALTMLHDVDVVVFIVDVHQTKIDEWIIGHLKEVKCPVILALNKVDTLSDKAEILPIIEVYSDKMSFAAVIPISAKQGIAIDVLEAKADQYLPASAFLFSEDEITDKSTRFLVAEAIREKLMRCLGQELPYAVTVAIDRFKKNEVTEQFEIAATIFVERKSQKGIVIGKGGKKLKEIGRLARLDINKILDGRCHLELWVKVKSGWLDNDAMLTELGYGG